MCVLATLTDEREWGDKMKEGRREKKEMGRINKQIEAFTFYESDNSGIISNNAFGAILKDTIITLDDFFLMTLGSVEITIICSNKILEKIKKLFHVNPIMEQGDLVGIGITFDEKYYKLPNITFSLIRKLALKEIVIAETVSSYTEVVFICHQKDLSTILESFSR